MEEINVLVLSGGPSPERSVSLQSGQMVSDQLDSDRYRVVPVQVARDGVWCRAGEAEEMEDDGSGEEAQRVPCGKGQLTPEIGRSIDRVLIGEEIDVAFLAMHGFYGEDGKVQGLLESFGVKYTGSGVCASALAMDKGKSRHMFMQNRIRVPRWTSFDRKTWQAKSQKLTALVEKELGLPCFVKPNDLGSSIGVNLVDNVQRLRMVIESNLQISRNVIVEELLEGREVTCGVLEKGGRETRTEALPIVEIRPKREFFDFSAKYKSEFVEEIVPADLDSTEADAISKAALRAHHVLGCAGFSRTDMILCDGEPYVLELNTIPGLTPVSLFPKAAEAAGLSFPEVLNTLIQTALGSDLK